MVFGGRGAPCHPCESVARLGAKGALSFFKRAFQMVRYVHQHHPSRRNRLLEPDRRPNPVPKGRHAGHEHIRGHGCASAARIL